MKTEQRILRRMRKKLETAKLKLRFETTSKMKARRPSQWLLNISAIHETSGFIKMVDEELERVQ